MSESPLAESDVPAMEREVALLPTRPAPEPLPPEALAPSTEADLRIARTRRAFGYFLTVLSIVLLLGTGVASLAALDRMLPGDKTTFEMVRFGAHGLITLALVWFFYQLLRMAERMILPQSLLSRADILLGNQAGMPVEKLVDQFNTIVLKALEIGATKKRP